jgi:hypothetical protein
MAKLCNFVKSHPVKILGFLLTLVVLVLALDMTGVLTLPAPTTAALPSLPPADAPPS